MCYVKQLDSKLRIQREFQTELVAMQDLHDKIKELTQAQMVISHITMGSNNLIMPGCHTTGASKLGPGY